MKRKNAISIKIIIPALLILSWIAIKTSNISDAAFGETSSWYYLSPPNISEVTPVSFRLDWAPHPQENSRTHYQPLIDGSLYGCSLYGNTVIIHDRLPGTIIKAAIVVYHEGTRVGVSSPTSILLGPPKPSTIFVTDITTSTFQLSWMPVSTSTSYKIYVDEALHSTVSGSQTTLLMTGFQPGQIVKIHLIAVNPSSDSYPSDSTTVQLKPKAPQLTVVIDQIKQTSYQIKWEAVEGAATYTIYTEGLPYAGVGSETLSYTITDREPGSYSTVKIQAQNSSGGSEFSEEKKVLLIPANPLIPWATGVSSYSLTLNWFSVKGATFYKIYRDVEWQIGTINVPATSAFFHSGFNPGEISTFTIVAGNSSGESGHSEGLMVKMTTDRRDPALYQNINMTVLNPLLGMPLEDAYLCNTSGKTISLKELIHSRCTVCVIMNERPPRSNTPEINLKFIESISMDTEMKPVHFIVILQHTTFNSFSNLKKHERENLHFYDDAYQRWNIPTSEVDEIKSIIIDSKGKIKKICSGIQEQELKLSIIEGLIDEIPILGSLGRTLKQQQYRFNNIHKKP